MLKKAKELLGLTPKVKPEDTPINLGVGLKDNKVVITVAKPISIITMDKKQCTNLIEALLKTQTLIK